jgi:hypothetical protein
MGGGARDRDGKAGRLSVAAVASPLPESHVPPPAVATSSLIRGVKPHPAHRAVPAAQSAGGWTSTRIEPVTLATTDRPVSTRQSTIEAMFVWPCSQSGGRRRPSSQR